MTTTSLKVFCVVSISKMLTLEIFYDVIYVYLYFVSIPRAKQKLQIFGLKTNLNDFPCYIEEIRKVTLNILIIVSKYCNFLK